MSMSHGYVWFHKGLRTEVYQYYDVGLNVYSHRGDCSHIIGNRLSKEDALQLFHQMGVALSHSPKSMEAERNMMGYHFASQSGGCKSV